VAALLGLFFVGMHIRCRTDYRMALPVRNTFIADWMKQHSTKRTVQIRVSDKIAAPLTYGVLRPVILLPKCLDWTDEKNLRYILAHEFTHIRRFDIIKKWMLVAAVCVHWFNPLVWVMYILANRDIELSCDETVVRSFGETMKSSYALALIGMEERRSRLFPLSNSFSKNATEERVRAIMKIQKKSMIAITVALLMVVSVATVFAASAQSRAEDNPPLQSIATELPKELAEKYAPLLALRFDGYEDMSISEYRDKAWGTVGQDEQTWMALLEKAAQDESLAAQASANNDAYFIQHILIPTLAERWDTRDFSGVILHNGASIEYSGSYQISDGKHVTMRERNKAISDIDAALQAALNSKATEQLMDENKMMEELALAVQNWQDASSNDFFHVSCDTHYLYDDSRNTNHSESDAPEISYLPATKEQYDWVLSLKKDGYKNMSIAEFNDLYSEIIVRADYDPAVFDSLMLDMHYGPTAYPLTDEELEFIKITFAATGCEFAVRHQQQYTNEVRLPWFDRGATKDSSTIYVSADYSIQYEILNEQSLTVGERDNMLIGIANAIQSFIDSQPENALINGEALLKAETEKLGTQYSNEKVKVSIVGLHYEAMVNELWDN